MALTSLTAATGVFAKSDAKTATITLTGVAAGAFVLSPYEAKVSSDLDDRYADKVGYTDDTDEPTMLDAAIALHLDVFGEDFASYAPLTVDTSEGWAKITSFLGEATSAVGYWNNHIMSGGLTDTVKDGDFAYFAIYQDAVGWSDSYVFADALEKKAYVGEKAEITFSYAGWSGNTPAAGLTVTVGDEEYGVTDKNGKIVIDVNFIDNKDVSVKTKDGSYIFPAYCKLCGTSKLYDYIKAEIEAGVKYTLGNGKSFGLKDATALADYALTGYDISEYIPAFVNSVNENLAANSGKLISPYSAESDPKEDAALYGAVIIIYELCGIDFTDIKAAFSSINFEEAKPSSPYYYRFAVDGAIIAGRLELAKAAAQDLIDSNYTMGKGMFLGTKDMPFYNCDNTAYFLMTLFPFRTVITGDIYKKYIDDAIKVINTYIKPDGAFCDLPDINGIAMNPNVNADSTALAMGAFAALGDFDKAFKLYKNLVEGFESKTGIFTFGGIDSALSTKDALLGLAMFGNLVRFSAKEHPAHVNTVTKGKPATFKTAGKTVGYCCKICGHKVAQKTIPKLKAAKLSKVVRGKKSFTARWKRVKGVDGYQIRYSTSKKFKKKKTVTVKKAKTVKRKVKNLRAKKVYYVKIRAYKVINGKKQFSKWSKAKKVKTK